MTIAQHDGVPCTSQKISEITQVPAPYLSKLMQGLVRAQVVTSKRGLHGGFVLSQAASKLTILEVVDAVEPFQRIHECPLGLSSHAGTLCPLHRRLDESMAIVEKSFRDTTVAELLAAPGSVTPLCEDKKLMRISMANAGTKTKSKPKSAKTKKTAKEASAKPAKKRKTKRKT